MGGGYAGAMGGAVYNHNLHRYMFWSTAGLNDVLNEWNRKSRRARFFLGFSIINDYNLRNKAINNLIAARQNPTGEIAQKIAFKLESWSKEEGIPIPT